MQRARGSARVPSRGFAAILILLIIAGLVALGVAGWRGTKHPASIPSASNAASTVPVALDTSTDAGWVIGTWNNGLTYIFRSDGTFAEKSGNNVDTYDQKCNMFTGECSPHYVSSATST